MRVSLLFSVSAVAVGLPACTSESPTVTAPVESSAGLAAGTWRLRAPYPTDVYEAESASITDPATGRTTLFVIGGRVDRRTYRKVFRTVRAYDLTSNAWRARAQLPIRLTGANGAVAINGRIYVAGGVTSFFDSLKGWRGRRVKSLYAYNVATDRWSRLRDLPYASAYGISGAYGGHLYAAVFCDDAAVCGDGELLRYNPSTNRWTILGRTPHSPAFAGGGLVNGKFYLVDMDGNVDVYDIAASRWTAGPAAPFSQAPYVPCPSATATLQARVYLVGCHASGDFSGVHPMLVFDPGTRRWSEAAAPPIPATGHWWSLTRVMIAGRPGLALVGGASPDNHAQFTP
jgi:hypothetical protein